MEESDSDFIIKNELKHHLKNILCKQIEMLPVWPFLRQHLVQYYDIDISNKKKCSVLWQKPKVYNTFILCISKHPPMLFINTQLVRQLLQPCTFYCFINLCCNTIPW